LGRLTTPLPPGWSPPWAGCTWPTGAKLAIIASAGTTLPLDPEWQRRIQELNILRKFKLPGVYYPYTKKLYFEVSKFFDNKIYMYISIIYVLSSGFTKKPIFFMVYIKKRKFIM
jgi:hypothetical protein